VAEQGVQMLRPRQCRSCFQDRCSQLISACLPEIGCQTWTRTKTSGLTGRRATLTPPGNGTAGRTPTCIVPFRRRMPHVFGHGSILKLVGMAGFSPAASWSQAGRSEDRATFRINWRTRRELHPQPSRRQRGALLIELRVRNGGKCW
jgi:hypothetical protein